MRALFVLGAKSVPGEQPRPPLDFSLAMRAIFRNKCLDDESFQTNRGIFLRKAFVLFSHNQIIYSSSFCRKPPGLFDTPATSA
ncbi:MAG: hypothetical protein DRI24_00285 [Deltaproteobacteria bacterium]|nr:MAG: hypothetical protein DRI24_00285 [Deltaproteobacteria bacterium]